MPEAAAELTAAEAACTPAGSLFKHFFWPQHGMVVQVWQDASSKTTAIQLC